MVLSCFQTGVLGKMPNGCYQSINHKLVDEDIFVTCWNWNRVLWVITSENIRHIYEFSYIFENECLNIWPLVINFCKV